MATSEGTWKGVFLSQKAAIVLKRCTFLNAHWMYLGYGETSAAEAVGRRESRRERVERMVSIMVAWWFVLLREW